jgi:hypothetical protein
MFEDSHSLLNLCELLFLHPLTSVVYLDLIMAKLEPSQLKQLLDRPSLSAKASKVVLGGGSFTHQSHPNPEALPVRDIIKRALEKGIRTFDTSPYYGPSEKLLGDAFSQPSYDKSGPDRSPGV